MLGRRSWLLWAIAMVATLLVLPATASAITLRQGNTVSVAKGEVLSDDLYAFGNTITIDGTVDGDVVAFGQIVVITGNVRGSVITAAQTVRIDGTVDGSVRAAGQMVDVSGVVGGDALAAANEVTIGGDVKRDLAAGAQDVNIPGIVGRNVMTGSNSLLIGGSVGGDVRAESTRVTVANKASVAGNLDYWSTTQADVQGSVAGTTLRHEPPQRDRRSNSGGGVAGTILAALIAWVQSFVGFLLLGLLMVFALRGPTERGSRTVADRFWPSLGVGFVVFFATPMVAGLIFLIGLFLGAWWLAFVLFAAVWLLLLAGVIVGSLAVGRAILRKASSAAREPSLAWALALGLAVMWVVAAVPVLGWLALWAVMLAGSGALLLRWMGRGEKPVAVPAAASPANAAEPAPSPSPAPSPAPASSPAPGPGPMSGGQ